MMSDSEDREAAPEFCIPVESGTASSVECGEDEVTLCTPESSVVLQSAAISSLGINKDSSAEDSTADPISHNVQSGEITGREDYTKDTEATNGTGVDQIKEDGVEDIGGSCEQMEVTKTDETAEKHVMESNCHDYMQEVDLTSSTGSSCLPSESESSPSVTASPCRSDAALTKKEDMSALYLIEGDMQVALSASSVLVESDPPSVLSNVSSDSGIPAPLNDFSTDIDSSGETVSTVTIVLKDSDSTHPDTANVTSVSEIQRISCDSHEPSSNESFVPSDEYQTHSNTSDTVSGEISPSSDNSSESLSPSSVSPIKSSIKDDSDDLLTELESELLVTTTTLESTADFQTPNGFPPKVSLMDIPDHRELKTKHEHLVKQHEKLKSDHLVLKVSYEKQGSQTKIAQMERDSFMDKLNQLQNSSAENIYQAQIKELETTIANQQKEIQATRDKLTSHDTAAKRAINTLQTELKLQVEKITKLYEEARRDKDSMTVRYAQAEQKNIELQDRMIKNDRVTRDNTKDKDQAIGRFKSIKAEKQKIQEIFEAKCGELGAARRQIEQMKETLQTVEMKAKWAQNKLKVEQDLHKETRSKLEDSQRKLKEGRDEAEQIRKECQSMVRTCQASAGEKEEQMKLQKQERTDQDEVHYLVKRELDTIKTQHKDLIAELKTYKDKVRAQESERLNQEETLDRFKVTLQNQKKDNKELQEKLVQLEPVEHDLNSARERLSNLEQCVSELEQCNTDLKTDMDGCSRRESEHLEFTQKISDKNARLLSENTSLQTKLTAVTAEQERLTVLCTQLEERNKQLEQDLEAERRLREDETSSLSTRLTDRIKNVEDLTRKVDEERDEIRTLRRKHQGNIKDLTRQLQQAKRRLDTVSEPGQSSGGDLINHGSMGSRTSSNGSLDTVGVNQLSGTGSLSRGSSQEPVLQDEHPPIVEVVEVDKMMLVEKIVRLQKAHARKNEKLEFLEDHINQMVEEVKKKSRIIQNYVMREESGTLSPESSDINKAQLTKKGGIMASLYSSHLQDGGMTIDLSLEINRKLQAVLEDMLLKNITLKESLETLGEEISRLSQENRQIRLEFQQCKSQS